MFWGLILEPNKRYTQTVEKAFHLSMASLDASTANNGLVQVMIIYNDRNFLLCTLQKGSIWQVPLDLNFQEGTKIAFTSNGGGHVHLTGYLIQEDGFDDLEDFEEGEEDEEEDEDEDEVIPTLTKINDKRKARNSQKKDNELKPAKKSKLETDDDEDDDDDDESDVENGDELLEVENDSDDSDDEDVEDEDEDEDEEDDDDDDDDDEQEESPVKPTKKQKQQNQQSQLNQQNHQNQQNKKDKNKLVNGKETKPEKAQGKQKKNKENSKNEEKPEPKKRSVEGGVQIEDLKIGEGAPAKGGKFVSVYYVGRLQNGKKFDQTQQGEGFKFRLGKGEVIKGWDVGIGGMKVGGKRRIVIPPNMAYGAKGSPPVIPPNSTLNFEVELRAIH